MQSLLSLTGSALLGLSVGVLLASMIYATLTSDSNQALVLSVLGAMLLLFGLGSFAYRRKG